jgi:hypothetical protein
MGTLGSVVRSVALGYRLSAISYRLSAIGYRLSAIDDQLSASYRLTAGSFSARMDHLRHAISDR